MRRARSLAALAGIVILAGCSDAPSGPDFVAIEEGGGSWKTWVLRDGAELRPPAPPAPTRAEVEEIMRLQASAGAAQLEEIQHWAGNPTSPWTAEMLELLELYWILLPDVRTASPAHSARVMALLHVAMYDALVATWDAKYAYLRDAPYRADSRVKRLLDVDDLPSYPSEHAAAAAAAAEVLKYAFPREDAARFDDLARRAGEARVAAGVAYPSDVDAGWALGRAVAARVLAHARQDGSERVWQGSVPQGEAMWAPTGPRFVERPFDPLAGSWKTWVIPSGSAFRPAPPPALGSAEFQRDLEELRKMPARRTVGEADRARYWATDAPSAWWELFAEEEIEKHGLPTLHAARAHALISTTLYDAFVACWDAKFHYWTLRPITADPTLQPVFSTPPFPSYPSGHSTMSTAAAEMFAYLFPERAEYYHDKAYEASMSRVWAAVHYRFDVETGDALGTKVGIAAVGYARQDGAER